MDPASLWMIGSMASAGLGALGQHSANKTNRNLARDQMDFQSRMATSAQAFSERMANTSVQRSVADYKAAGLNPALAYERSAAAPAGVTAGGAASKNENTMRDIPNVVSNALMTKKLQQDMQIAAVQSEADQAVKHNTAQKLNVEREEVRQRIAVLQHDQLDRGQRRYFDAQNQPHSLRAMEMRNIASKLGLTGLENEQELEAKLQSMSGGKGGGGNAKFLLQLVKTIFQQSR